MSADNIDNDQSSAISSSASSYEPNIVENPFKMPEDEDIFTRMTALKSIDEEEAGERKLKVWEKTGHAASSEEPRFRYKKGNDFKLKKHSKLMGDRLREKEKMDDFIAKKKEMFLVQMSLDTKQEEIRKLEVKARMKEDALKKSELMLEEDAIRFDAFLKENDRKAQEAIKRLGKESADKAEKQTQIKKLNADIAKIRAEMGKCSEQLEDCLKYKAFLDSLAPSEWKEKHKNDIARRGITIINGWCICY
eukprot:247761_1